MTGKEAKEEPSETKSYHQKQQKIAMRSASWHWVNLISEKPTSHGSFGFTTIHFYRRKTIIKNIDKKI